MLEEVVGRVNSSDVKKKSHLSRRFSIPLSSVSYSDLHVTIVIILSCAKVKCKSIV